jgi:hypothetical protein
VVSSGRTFALRESRGGGVSGGIDNNRGPCSILTEVLSGDGLGGFGALHAEGLVV